MAQSNSQDFGLFTICADLFVDKPKSQPDSQSKPPPQPPASQSKPPPQPASQSGPSARRQDELVKKFPGSKIIRRPYNPHSTFFPCSYCDYYMESFYEYVRDSKMDYVERHCKILYARAVVLKFEGSKFGGPDQEI